MRGNTFLQTLVLRYRVMTAGYVTSGLGERLVVDGILLFICGTLVMSFAALLSTTMAKLLR